MKNEKKVVDVVEEISEEKVLSTPTIKKTGDVVTDTKTILENQKHVSFIVPIGEREKEGAIETVKINGYRIDVPKGVLLELPESVVKILSEKYRVNMTAGRSARADSRPDKIGVL